MKGPALRRGHQFKLSKTPYKPGWPLPEATAIPRQSRNLPVRAEHMAILNPKWAVAIWRHPKTARDLVGGSRLAAASPWRPQAALTTNGIERMAVLIDTSSSDRNRPIERPA
jgi:hypothetical protein